MSSTERHRVSGNGQNRSSLSDSSSLDFSMSYPMYQMGSFLQPSGRAVDTAGHSPNQLEVPNTLDEAWRNVGYSEALESSKRQISQSAAADSAADFHKLEPSEKKPRLESPSFSTPDNIFKSTLDTLSSSLESKLSANGAELLGGISESFDFASTPDPPDDNSNLAQSISMIQETLDQSIAQSEDKSDDTRKMFSSSDVPSGNHQGHSTPLELTNGAKPVSANSSTFDSLTPEDRIVTVKEYRSVAIERVFECNGEVIRRTLIQKEPKLERTISISMKQYLVLIKAQDPWESLSDGSLADISNSQSSRESKRSTLPTPNAQTNGKVKNSESRKRPAEEEPLPALKPNDVMHEIRNIHDITVHEPYLDGTESERLESREDKETETSVISEDAPPAEEPLNKKTKDESESTEVSKEESDEMKAPVAKESTPPAHPVEIPLAAKMECLAQWTNEIYYMATIRKVYKNGRVLVKFADGTQDSVKSEVVVPLLADLEIGRKCYAGMRGRFELAIIKERTVINQKEGYVVELHSKKTAKVTRDKVAFSAELVEAFRRDTLSTDETPQAKKTDSLVTCINDLDLTSTDLSSTLETADKSRACKRVQRKVVEPVASESGGLSGGSSFIPPSLVFEGMGFLLTDTERPAKAHVESGDSSVTPSDEGESEFNKDQLQSLIEEYGGVVFKSFTEAECATSLESTIERYLLSRSHMKTLKYVLCLASGIRCLSFRVIHAAIKEGKMPEVTRYQLAAGFSLIKKGLVEQPSAHSLIFKNMTIAVITEKSQFVNTWSQVIIAAGGRIASKLPQRQSPQKSNAASTTDGVIRFMVTTPECSSLTLRSARALRISPVSSEWVVQSIIHAKLLDPEAHPAFAYDFRKST